MADFPFIVSNGPKVPKDPALRTLIRKQAMRDVGIARKKRGRANPCPQAVRNDTPRVQEETSDSSGAGSSSTSTPPDPVPCTDGTTPEDEQLVLASETLTDETFDWLSEQVWVMPCYGNPMTEYEQLRAKYNVDILDLSILTSFNVGGNIVRAIFDNPELLNTLWGSQMQSYLQFVPNRYGHKPFLTDVVDCVLAKVHSRLHPANQSFNVIVMQKYAKALASVQKAIMGEESSLDPDLLCAIQMLGLHEMLDHRRAVKAYDHHVDGSALIIQRRTPSRFNTDYEKLLFHSHICAAFTRALYEQRECYLEQPEWIELYQSLIEDTPWLTDRSEIVIRIRSRLLSLATMLCQTTKAMNPDTYDEGLLLVLELKAREIHHGLLKALDAFKAYVLSMSMANTPESELALRREIFGTALECLCVYKRILASFCEEERLQLEKEAQELALTIMNLQKQPAPRHSWIYSSHEKGVAASIQLTREAWERDLSGATSGEKRLIAYARWKEFNSYLHGDQV
ncbi:hypothetical protein Q7P37_000895 [Cladosporium fusiforme]